MSEAEAPGVPVCYRHPGREAHIRCQRCDRTICPDCMTPASVGFQCPECVAEGKRTARAPRTSYGGIIPRGGTSTSIVLIAVNVVVWLAINASGGQGSRLLYWLSLHVQDFCFSPDGVTCVQRVPGMVHGAWWELLTSAFTQVTIGHIFFNVLNVFILGPQLEQMLGRARFLAVYLLSGLAGSAMVYAIAPVGTVTYGASGAVFGLMGAFLVIVLRLRAQVQGMLVWIAISFAYSFAVPGISWQAHLGGFLGGSAAAAVIVLAPRARRSAVQWSGLATILVVIAVTVVARTMSLV